MAKKMTVDGKAMYPAPVGSGCIKMKEIIASLEARGYDGIYTIEHFVFSIFYSVSMDIPIVSFITNRSYTFHFIRFVVVSERNSA